MPYICKNLFVAIVFAFTLFACVDESQVDVPLEGTPYFDLKGLVEEQILLLDSLNPEVEMLATISGKEDELTLRKDSAGWAETLKLYVEADLNKPVLQDQYVVIDSVIQKSNMSLKLYQARQPDDVDIPFMKVYYQGTLSSVRRIEAFFREENPLYSTQRSMNLRFKEQDGQVLLAEYSTSGKQKMIFRDSILYQNTGRIMY